MEYSNSPTPEGINTSKDHPLKDLAKMLAVVVLGLVALFWLLGLLANYLAPRVPFEYEKELLGDSVPENAITEGPVPAYLQSLADRLVAQMDLPDGMSINTFYVEDPEVNAAASFGGNLQVNSGLLAAMPDENSLAMVLGHEIAHVKLRHPMRSLGRMAVFAATAAVLTGSTGNTLGDVVISSTSGLTGITYTRQQEKAADALGLQAMVGVYGHVGGALELFDILLAVEKKQLGLRFNFLNDHPLSERRTQAIIDQAREHHWPLTGPLTPMPESIIDAAKAAEAKATEAKP
jgi:predicted Zn-dependent protease